MESARALFDSPTLTSDSLPFTVTLSVAVLRLHAATEKWAWPLAALTYLGRQPIPRRPIPLSVQVTQSSVTFSFVHRSVIKTQPYMVFSCPENNDLGV
jgi:hypothetical protein